MAELNIYCIVVRKKISTILTFFGKENGLPKCARSEDTENLFHRIVKNDRTKHIFYSNAEKHFYHPHFFFPKKKGCPNAPEWRLTEKPLFTGFLFFSLPIKEIFSFNHYKTISNTKGSSIWRIVNSIPPGPSFRKTISKGLFNAFWPLREVCSQEARGHVGHTLAHLTISISHESPHHAILCMRFIWKSEINKKPWRGEE